MTYDDELEQAKKAAVLAGRAIMEFYDKPTVIETKTENDFKSPLTEADLAAGRIIEERLSRFSYPMLTEDHRDSLQRLDSELVWIVDPLDGTKEFIKKNGEFTVNIALVKDQAPVAGVIYVPTIEVMYYAVSGEGTFHEHKGEVKQIHVSDRQEPQELILVKSRSHASPELARIIDSVGFSDTLISGSSIKGCLVAGSAADVYIRLGPINEWDICAMNIIVTEAGGRMTNLDGRCLKYNQKNTLITSGFLASNAVCHNRMLTAISSSRH